MHRRTDTPSAPVQPAPEAAATIVRWDELALERITEMASRKVIAGATQTMTQVWFKRGALVARHRHAGEQMTFVLDGALRLMLDGEPARAVRAGEVVTIPAGAAHQLEVLEDSLVITTYGAPCASATQTPPG